MPVIIALYSAVFGELQAPQEILERQVCLLLFSEVWYVYTASGWLACAIQPSHTPLFGHTRVQVSI